MAHPYPGSTNPPNRGRRGLRLSAVRRTATARTSAFVTSHRVSVLVLLSPKLDLILFCALDASLAHLDVLLYLGLGEFPVLPEDDVEAHAEDAQGNKNQSSNKYFHNSSKTARRPLKNSVGDDIASGGTYINYST